MTDKRKASETFESSQLVKRVRPDGADISSAVSVAGGFGGSGALIQSVCPGSPVEPFSV